MSNRIYTTYILNQLPMCLMGITHDSKSLGKVYNSNVNKCKS